MKTYYITTPIYYVNDVPHIGHAYTTLACDVLARFMRLDGNRVHFLTGTDEHGQKVEKAAATAGVSPQQFTDKVSQNFRDLARDMNISNDDFIRTTEARHLRSCQAIWEALERNGDIYLGKYAGWYAVRDEAFYDEGELTTGADGKKRAPSGAEVEWVEEPSYFFRLSAWQDRLLKYYDENPRFIAPTSRRNEVVSFVRQGLTDLSVSRTTFNWGVKVPGAPGHIMYVWLDALTNYITAVGYPDVDSENFKAFWPADLHMVGKDIVRFHAVYWPAFLMAAGVAPPKRVFAHGWWTVEGQKMSKSLGNVISPHDMIAKYGLDPVRYFLLREVPFGQDGDFSQRAMVQRLNGDLANDFGNLAQRVLSFVHKNANAEVPQPGPYSNADTNLLRDAERLYHSVKRDLFNLNPEGTSAQALDISPAFHRALEVIWAVINEANSYVDEQAPWALRKTDPERMNTVLYVLMETLRRLAILCQPFIPASMANLLDQLAVPVTARTFASLSQKLIPGTILSKAPSAIFPSQAMVFERKVIRALEEGKGPFMFSTFAREATVPGVEPPRNVDAIAISGERVYLVEIKSPKRPSEIVTYAQQLDFNARNYVHSESSNTTHAVPLVIIPSTSSFTDNQYGGVPVIRFDDTTETFSPDMNRLERIVTSYLTKRTI